LGAAPPWPAQATDNEGARRAHHAEAGKWADSFWGLTALGAVGNGGSPSLRWRKREKAPHGASELALATAPSSGDLYTEEMDE
jgi:hypothetical protein